MRAKRIDRHKIINAFLAIASQKSAGAVSLFDIATALGVKKASLYNHFKSREEMYEATICFCCQYLENVSFGITEENGEGEKKIDANKGETFEAIFEKLVKQFFRSHIMEPLLQIYSFVHSEKYFNQAACDAAEKAKQKIQAEIKKLMLQYFAPHSKQKNIFANQEKIESTSCILSSLISEKLDSYVLQRKDAIRKNPEQSLGSLFELPFEETVQEKLVALAKDFLL